MQPGKVTLKCGRYRLTLIRDPLRTVQVTTPRRSIGMVRLGFAVVDSRNLTPHVFRILHRPGVPRNEPLTEDQFNGVCSPADLEEFPEAAPTGVPAFYRTDRAAILFLSRQRALETWDALLDEIKKLLVSMDRCDRLGPPVRILIEPTRV